MLSFSWQNWVEVESDTDLGPPLVFLYFSYLEIFSVFSLQKSICDCEIWLKMYSYSRNNNIFKRYTLSDEILNVGRLRNWFSNYFQKDVILRHFPQFLMQFSPFSPYSLLFSTVPYFFLIFPTSVFCIIYVVTYF